MAFMRQARILIQVAQRAQAERVPPALPAMLGRIVEHVAALAQRGEIARHVVPRIMIEMRAGQHHIGRADAGEVDAIADRDPPPPRRPPAPGACIPPAPVAEMCDEAPMRPRAAFAARAGTTEADRVRHLRPVDRIQPAVFGADRHRDSMSHARVEEKRNLRLSLPSCSGRVRWRIVKRLLRRSVGNVSTARCVDTHTRATLFSGGQSGSR
jgi:hypothetical protein